MQYIYKQFVPNFRHDWDSLEVF